MMHDNPLPVGYHPLPAGHLANVVTCLEMTERPALRPAPKRRLQRSSAWGPTDTDRFRALFRAIGQDIMWFSRLFLPEEKLGRIIGDPEVHCLALVKDGAGHRPPRTRLPRGRASASCPSSAWCRPRWAAGPGAT